MAENFIIDLIAALKKSQSKKQIREDAKNLGDIKVPLVGTLNKTKTRAQLKQDLSSLNGTVKLTGKVDNKGITASVQQATRQAQKQAKSQPIQVDFSIKKDKLISDIKLLGQQNSKLFKDVGMSQKYTQLLDSAKLANSTKELQSLRLQLGAFRSELKVTGNAGMTLTDALRNGFSKTLQLFGSYGIIMQFTRQLRNAWTEAKELDSAMTNLSRVNAEISRSDFPDYLDKVISKTKQLAVATKDYIDAMTTFSRAGYNLADSEILADAAVQLEKVGDMSSESASKALLSGLQGYAEIDGYGMDQLTEKAQALIDKIDLIGNVASITQAEVSEGIQAVGSVMSDANTSVDEFIAMLGAGNRAVQDSNKVALAIRTSALRIRGCTVELQEMGEETDDVIESTSTLAEKIKALTNINGSGGVDILEADKETFRSIYDIYNDISKVYSDMSDMDASALLELIAGKNRSNQISAVLNNMAEANELLNKSLNATGTASSEYQIYLDSAKASTERFGVAMTETYSNIINGETVKGLANAGSAVLDFANSFGIIEGTFRGFLTLGILKGITALTLGIKNSVVQLNNFGTALNTVNNMSNLTKGTTNYAKAFDTLKSSCANLTDAQLKQVLANDTLSNSERIAILCSTGLTKAQAKAKLTQMGLTRSTDANTASNTANAASANTLKGVLTGLTVSAKTAWAAMSTLQKASLIFTVASVAISTAWGALSSMISDQNQKLEETRQKNIEAAEAASESADKLKDLYVEYNRLASIQDRTTSQEEEFKTAVENINSVLGDKAKALEGLTVETEEYAKALSKATKEELQNQAVNATVGRKAAEEALQNTIWDRWEGSTVTVDTNSLSDDAERAKAIISDTLKEFETLNPDFESSWDVSSRTPEGYLAYYNALIKAREDLVIASKDDEALLNTEIYSDMNNAINTMSESLDTYIEQRYEEAKLNYMVQNGIPSTVEEYKSMEAALDGVADSSDDLQNEFKELLASDFSELLNEVEEVKEEISSETISSFQDAWSSLDNLDSDSPMKSLKEDLLSLAEAGQLTIEKFTETEGSDSFLSMLGIKDNDIEEINKLISQINKLKSSADQLSSMKKGISGLSENLYNRQQDPGVAIDADTLAGMDSALKEQTEEWEKYVTVLGDASSSMEDVQKATDELATAYVNSNNFLANLTEAKKGEYITQLEAMGVANASIVVEERLSAQREVAKYKTQALAIATRDLADSQSAYKQRSVDAVNATYENSKAFLEQSEMSDLAKASLFELIANEQIFASQDLNLSQKITELNKLASSYLGVAQAIAITSAMGADPRYYTEEYIQQKTKEILSNHVSTGIRTTPKSPGNNKNSKDNKDKEETIKEFSETFDWIERLTKRLQKAFDKWLKQAETALTSKFVTKYYNKAASAAKKQLSTYSKAYNRYMAQANAVGLDEKYASKVRNGTLDIESIYAKGSEKEIKKYEENADKIKSYQDWLDKANESMDSFIETAEKLYNLPLDKAAKKIEIFNNKIDLLDKRLENATKLKTKNDIIDEQTKQEEKTLNSYKKARTESTRARKAAGRNLTKKGNLNADDGITKEERKKIKYAVKKGKEVSLAYFTENSEGYKAAVKYNESLKANKQAVYDAKTAQQEYNRYLVESAKQKFDNVADDYNKKLQKIDWKKQKYDNKMSEIEASGKKVGISYYNTQKNINDQTLKQLTDERDALEKNLKTIKKGTDEWYEAKDEIQQVNNKISDCVKTTYELNNAVNQLHFDFFDDVSEGISRIATEQEFLRGLFAHEKNVDTETGNFTDAGLANLGSLAASHYVTEYDIDRYRDEIKELQRMADSGELVSEKLGLQFNSREDLLKYLDDTYTKEQDLIKNSYSLRTEIYNLMKEQYQAELDYLKELIDAKKESLQASKDLHDYNKTINEKTNDITTLRKQIAAYSGDTSQEGMAKLQKLQKELADKEEDLAETEYDRYISDQQDMLDKLYEEYEDLLSKKMDKFMTLVQEGLDTANSNMAIIASYIQQVAEDNGYDLQTDGLFDGSSKKDIKDNSNKAAKDVKQEKKDQSGTKENKKMENSIKLSNAKDYIKENAQNADKKRSEYGAVNKAIYDATGGLVLTDKQLERLAKILGIEYDGSSKKSNLYKGLVEFGYIKPDDKKKDDSKKDDSKKLRSKAKSYIKEHASKAKKKKTEYTDVNQKIYEDKANAYKGTGKILSTKELKGLSKELGVEYDNGSKKGNLYKKLKSIKFPGFKKGGVVSVDDIEKQVKANGDDGIVSVKNGEGILTPAQTEMLQKFLDQKPEFALNPANMDDLISIPNPIGNIKPISNAKSMNQVVNIDMGGITMNGVDNPKEFVDGLLPEFQRNKGFERLLDSMTNERLAGAGNLNKYKHRF